MQNRGKQIFVNNTGDCSRLCFVLFFICHLSLKEDYTSLLVDLGLVMWIAWNNEIWAEASYFSCALFALWDEFSYIHQPWSYNRDDIEQSFSQPVINLLQKSEINLCCYKPTSFWSLCCFNRILPKLTDKAFLPPLELCWTYWHFQRCPWALQHLYEM